MMKTKRTLMRALVAGTALAAAASAFADTTYDNFNGYIDFWHPFGNPNTATYGETFTAPTNGDVNLQDFGFYMGSPFLAGDILLRAYIATWTGTQAGTLLYTSADFDFANTGDDHITFSTGGLTLTPGASYVAFLSVSELYGLSSGEAYISQGDPTIPGGNFVYYNNGGDFAALFNSTWDATGLKPDWAFNATFTAGGGGGLTLVSAASVKGPFAIDLPLSGPSGVEDRSGGPNQKYTVVMTFNQNIVSVGSASSTCGSVQSIVIDSADAHNVNLNLVNVAQGCNESTITVTADSITDDQGNVLDSASVGLGLLLGDVNGDRVVNSLDTNEAQTHKGQKTVQQNFRSDVNANGHITFSDIQIIRQQHGTSLP
jgi:hypothetical protein